MSGAWIITEDRSSGPWPNQAGDTMPGASEQAIKAATESGQEFRVTNYARGHRLPRPGLPGRQCPGRGVRHLGRTASC